MQQVSLFSPFLIVYKKIVSFKQAMKSNWNQEIVKHFQAAMVTNHFNPPLLPSLVSSIHDENCDLGKTGKSLMKQAKPAEACTN